MSRVQLLGIALLAAAAVPALAGSGAPDAAKAPATKQATKQAMKAGIYQKCLQEKSGKGEPLAWVGLGELDQIRGDLKAAYEKYRKALALNAALVDSPIDFTWVADVIWVQSSICPVPVPPLAAGLALADKVPETTRGPDLVYPEMIFMDIRSEGNATPRVWIGPEGKPIRIAIVEASSGPPGIIREDLTRVPGAEAAERFEAKVQFALSAIEVLRGYDFGKAAAGKVFERKFAYLPNIDMLERTPDSGSSGPGANPVDTSAAQPTIRR